MNKMNKRDICYKSFDDMLNSGYRVIPREILFAIMSMDLNLTETKVWLAIYDMTIGYTHIGRKTHKIDGTEWLLTNKFTLNTLMKRTWKSPRGISRALETLRKRNMIEYDATPKGYYNITLQHKYPLWRSKNGTEIDGLDYIVDYLNKDKKDKPTNIRIDKDDTKDPNTPVIDDKKDVESMSATDLLKHLDIIN
jgi:hypothetical protein